MIDLPQKLRDLGKRARNIDANSFSPMFVAAVWKNAHEAADEIDQLRATVKALCDETAARKILTFETAEAIWKK